MKLSEQLKQDHDCGDFGKALAGYAERAEGLERAAEIYAAERDHAKACYDRAVRILTGIHALLYPPRFTDNDGRTWQFKSPLAEEQMQELSDRIRALPDEIEAIDAAMKTPNPPAKRAAGQRPDVRLSARLGISCETMPHKGHDMPMFRKKPVVVEARQFFNDGSSYELIHWINEGQHAIGREFARWHNNEIIVPTLEGQHIASPGDWIIRGVAGEHYPCKPEIFSATYEAA